MTYIYRFGQYITLFYPLLMYKILLVQSLVYVVDVIATGI